MYVWKQLETDKEPSKLAGSTIITERALCVHVYVLHVEQMALLPATQLEMTEVTELSMFGPFHSFHL